MEFWFFIGIALILWVIYDLYSGKVLLHREIRRENEPILYWVTCLLWLAVALYVLLGSF